MSQQEGVASLRYGAPAAVVDPILSFLFDLRRMEEMMLSTLEHWGVSRSRLPQPFGAGHRDDEAADKCALTTSVDVVDADAAVSTTAVILREACGQSTPVYERVHPPSDSYEAVQRVLTWLDRQQQQQQQPSSPAARSLVTAFVAAGRERDAFLIDTTTRAEVHVRHPPKRHKKEEGNDATLLRNSEVREQAGEACCILSLSASEVRTAAAMCRQYEKLLKSGAKELEATIHAITTSDLAASYSCHAKWVEVAQADAKVEDVLLSSKILKENYEHLIRLNDALATCQAAVHSAYVTLEESVDVLLEEAQVVEREERTFQRCVAQARAECAGLHEVRRRLKRTREALEQASSGDA
ncbi:hypothetical protein ABL78_4268 [Leptomonas seymouri]|uniref:Uncharacterized protein n=1 Tax=Leptomonas seymouri TaxID=5684 RepID=A0A0N1IKE1_LEPSE|nr:hypothetical protein ABL78_4268 [Leptomonas seymouri]|eukprot:KPI86653.1 hypothetical protein ABL78_4268 [Leptomonas seymouri]